MNPLLAIPGFLLLAATPCGAQSPTPFGIRVVDKATGRGVPLVELETTHHLVYVTDSAGYAAIDAPELKDTLVYFHVRSHGYSYPKDGFGNRGVRLRVRPGAIERIEMTRVNVAERLYRVTGAGIYADSAQLGKPTPLKQPVRNGGVFGQDSVVNAIYGGKLYWFWGDTNRASYPLGNFAVSGATSVMPRDGGLPPARGVDLQYFVNDEGFSRKMCEIEGPGPVWIFGLMVVTHQGRERMLAHYSRMKNLGTRYEHGIVEYDDAKNGFVKVAEFPKGSKLHPSGNPVRAGDWFYFPNPYPTVRVRARYADIVDAKSYEAFGLQGEGVDRRWGWRRSAPVFTAREPQRLPRGVDSFMGLRDVETGRGVVGHGGTIHWNHHRKKWVMIALEARGRSMLGEVWFAEADTLMGPWGYARRIVTHDSYSFYNVKQHPYFDENGGRVLYFEGTYTSMFSGAKRKTPRYDYNQVMYRLDLDDRRLRLPIPVYTIDGEASLLSGREVTRRELWNRVRRTPFWARAAPGSPGFALGPTGTEQKGTVRIYRWTDGTGRSILRARGDSPGEGWKRESAPTGLAWPSPTMKPPFGVE